MPKMPTAQEVFDDLGLPRSWPKEPEEQIKVIETFLELEAQIDRGEFPRIFLLLDENHRNRVILFVRETVKKFTELSGSSASN